MLLQQVCVVLLCLCSGAHMVEVEVAVPERYLRPRSFNPHPLLATHPYAILLNSQPYAQFPRAPQGGSSSPVQFPVVPEAAQPTKSNTPGYITVPKNYAFAYAVKDRQSGDDFSHKQAHNGQSTRGEYRVKLPDGRTQIVSYTADSGGYKADVRYDEAPTQPSYKTDYRYRYHEVPALLTNSLSDYADEPRVIYKRPVPKPRPVEFLFSPSPSPPRAIQYAPLQLRAVPQTAGEYTSSDSPSYSGYAPPAPSTAATPIEEDQDDIPAPRKPFIPSTTTESSLAELQYILYPSQYV